MNLAKERKAIDAALNEYRVRLDTISEERFAETPPGGGWSYAEVYSHILQATLGSTMNVERCTHGNCEPTSRGPTFIGRLMLFAGRFPPVRVKTPPAIAAKMVISKITKEDARNMLIKCRKRVDDTTGLIKDASPASRIKHARLGMLNAGEWYKFIRIHAEHHLKQLRRIEKKFSNT